ncbi:MAG TPA: ferritin-like domain-containing protein, partial [Arthrobacter sp.]
SPAGGQPAVARTVSLLTSQARALLVPGQDEPGSALPAASAAASAASRSSPPAASAPSQPPAAAASTAASPPVTAALLATELAASGSQRLADAAMADGGIARLLAAVGTAQLLQASSLAAAAGVPVPDVSDPAAPQLSGACPSASASPSSSSSPSSAGDASARGGASAGKDPAPASLPAALAATVETELETVYGYQVALTRLGDEAAGPASKQLARHEALATGAEALSRMHCAPVPPREAGYKMTPDFLASPADGLGGLEASALPVYGDLVALSEGETRQWAISGLVGAARRSALWGADPGVLPGLTADPNGFPELP